MALVLQQTEVIVTLTVAALILVGAGIHHHR